MTQGVTPTWLRQVATALSSRYNVNVREGKAWAIDVDRKILSYRADHLLALDRDTCLGILLHELGHLHFTSNDWIDKATLMNQSEGLKEITFNAVNAFEDVRVNEKMSQSYNGSRQLIDAMNELLGGDGTQKFLTMNEDIKTKGFARNRFSVPDWHEVFYIAMGRLLNTFPETIPTGWYDQEKWNAVETCVQEARKRDLSQLNSTKEVYDFVENVVFPSIAKWLPTQTTAPQSGDNGSEMGQGEPSDEEGEEGNGNGSASTEQGEGEEQGDSGTVSDSKGDEKSEDGNGNPDDGEPSSGKEEQQAQAQPQPSQQQGQAKQPQQQSPHGTLEQWKRELEQKIVQAIKRGRINPDPDNRTQPFRDLRDADGTERKMCDAEKHLVESQSLQRQFANKFEALFRNNQYKRETPNQRTGRLDKRSLHKFALGKTRLFKRKLDISKKSYAVGFAMDLSSSMNEHEVRGSYHAMFAFTTTLQKLKIPYGIGFFSHIDVISKPFSTSKLVPSKLTRDASQVYGGGTNPSELFRKLFGEQLVQQKVNEKIAVILTDGEWNEGSYDTLMGIKKAHPEVHFYIVGLGLYHQLVERMEEKLQNTATIVNAENVEEVMTRYLEIARKHLL